MKHFAPSSEDQHAKANRGNDVQDYCRNCGQPFMAHINGTCQETKPVPLHKRKFNLSGKRIA